MSDERVAGATADDAEQSQGAGPPSRSVGSIRIHAIDAGTFRLDGGAMFGVVPKPLWERRIAPDARNRIPMAMRCLLVEAPDALSRTFTPWDGSPVPAERQIRGLEGARMRERELEPTISFITSVLGFAHVATENGWHRYGVKGGGSGRYVDLQAAPHARRGGWGVGSIHHLAWRVDDEAHQLELRAGIDEAGRRPTPVIDRFWFESVYFLEPGGVLFELATDGPGFGVDESLERLGETLVLPPWLESQRGAIESMLPPLHAPAPVLE